MEEGYGTNLNLKQSLVQPIFIVCLHKKEICKVKAIDQKTLLYTLLSYSESSFIQRLKQLWSEVCLFYSATLNISYNLYFMAKTSRLDHLLKNQGLRSRGLNHHIYSKILFHQKLMCGGNFNDFGSKYFYFEKVNGSHKSISLGKIFRNFLWEKKK